MRLWVPMPFVSKTLAAPLRLFDISIMALTVSADSLLSPLRFLQRNRTGLERSLERLATGRRVNHGRDDPAALMSIEQLNSRIAALEAESRSIERLDANSTIADGHSAQLSGMLNDLNGLLVASANTGALSDEEIAANQEQVNALVGSIQRFGGQAVDALGATGLENADALGETLGSATASLSALTSGGSLELTAGDLAAAQFAVETAASTVTDLRGTLGSYQKNTLSPRFNAVQIERENLMAARSRLQDTDYAEETSVLSRYQTLTEAGIRLLNIAREQQGRVLDLLG